MAGFWGILRSETRGPMEAGDETVSEILRRHLATERDYASYWKFSPDRQLEERHIAACLLAYLEAAEGWADATVASSERDPPDCYGSARGVPRFGIEVSELVHRKTVERHELRRNAERKGAPVPTAAAEPGDTAIWSAAALQVGLADIVSAKDKPASGGPFAPYMVAIFTDETAVTPQLVAEAIGAMTIQSQHIDATYLLLSYDPGAESFPNRIPVFKLPVAKARLAAER